MARKSKILDLPESLIKQINSMLLGKKITLKQIQDFINNHESNNGTIVSLGGCGRYKKAFDSEMKDISELDYLLQKLPDTINFNKESNVHKLISQIISKNLLKQMLGKESIETKELFFISKSLKDIMSSTKDREKIKADLKKEIQEETLQTVATVVKKAGVSKKNIELIRKALQEQCF